MCVKANLFLAGPNRAVPHGELFFASRLSIISHGESVPRRSASSRCFMASLARAGLNRLVHCGESFFAGRLSSLLLCEIFLAGQSRLGFHNASRLCSSESSSS